MIQNSGLSCFTRNLFFYLNVIVIQSYAIKVANLNHYCCGRSFSCDRDVRVDRSLTELDYLEGKFSKEVQSKSLLGFQGQVLIIIFWTNTFYSFLSIPIYSRFCRLTGGPSNFQEHWNLILSWCGSHGATFCIKDQTAITMPGYPVPEVDKEIFQELLCEYCVTVVRDAWRAECGHFYCRSCVEFLFR